MALQLLINQRNSLTASNDGSEVSTMKTFVPRGQHFADFYCRMDKEIFYFGGKNVPENKYISDDIISLTPIVKFARRKSIVTTSVNGLGEVIEGWNTMGYEIHIQGLLVDTKSQQYPKKQIKRLRAFFEIQKTAKVTGELFQDLGITEIYILSVNIAPFIGFPDTVRFELRAKSVEPLSFTLKP